VCVAVCVAVRVVICRKHSPWLIRETLTEEERVCCSACCSACCSVHGSFVRHLQNKRECVEGCVAVRVAVLPAHS